MKYFQNWWGSGLLGGVLLTLIVGSTVRRKNGVGLLDALTSWDDVLDLAVGSFAIGFVGGVVAWYVRWLPQKLGGFGDAILGLLLLEIVCVLAILLGFPKLFSKEYDHLGLIFVGMAAPLGFAGGWVMGHQFREEDAAERRAKCKAEKLARAESSSPSAGETKLGESD